MKARTVFHTGSSARFTGRIEEGVGNFLACWHALGEAA
jgi:hypothetical protein